MYQICDSLCCVIWPPLIIYGIATLLGLTYLSCCHVSSCQCLASTTFRAGLQVWAFMTGLSRLGYLGWTFQDWTISSVLFTTCPVAPAHIQFFIRCVFYLFLRMRPIVCLLSFLAFGPIVSLCYLIFIVFLPPLRLVVIIVFIIFLKSIMIP